MMNQHLTQEQLQLAADGELAPGIDHLRGCALCSNAVLQMVQMKNAVRQAMRTEAAPASLRRRILHRNSAPWWIGAAAAAALIIVIASTFAWRGRQTTLEELADMHVTLLAGANPVDVLSTDRHTVKPWFEGRVPFAVPVPDLGSTPFRLIGGRVVYWRANQGAYLLIGKNAHRISVFVFREQSGPKTFGEPPPAVSTLSWQAGGLTFIAIGDVPIADLDQLRAAFTCG
jgi:anti-sigma factor RsiW